MFVTSHFYLNKQNPSSTLRLDLMSCQCFKLFLFGFPCMKSPFYSHGFRSTSPTHPEKTHACKPTPLFREDKIAIGTCHTFQELPYAFMTRAIQLQTTLETAAAQQHRQRLENCTESSKPASIKYYAG